MNESVDHYLSEGCGRCPLGGTPDCKVHTWVEELGLLRDIVLDCGLEEEVKWGVPCYTFQNKNVLIISAFKEYCSLSFFKGVLLMDDQTLLVSPGPNSQAVRYFKFTSCDDINKKADIIRTYIFEALEIERAGLKVPIQKNPEPVPEELEAFFEDDPALKMAFEALTPGRQRGYILYFSAPKQSKTKISRIEKCIPLIMEGIGFYDRY